MILTRRTLKMNSKVAKKRQSEKLRLLLNGSRKLSVTRLSVLRITSPIISNIQSHRSEPPGL